jgi:tetratricopeptide (TPR) repeat protein
MSRRVRIFGSVGLPVLITLIAVAWHVMRRRDTAELLDHANHAIEQRDFAAARAMLTIVLERQPSDPAALLARGRLAGAETQWSEALAYLRRIPDTAPQSAAARYFEGLVLFEMHLPREAERAWLHTLARAPDSHEALEQLANLYAFQMRVPELRSTLEQLLTLQPLTLKHLVLLATAGESWGFPPDRIEALRAVLAADPDDIESRIALARLYVRIEQCAVAIALLEPIQPQIRHDARVCAALAEARMNQGDWPGARVELDRAPADGLPNPWLLFSQGRWLEEAGQLEEASTSFNAVLQIDPMNIDATYHMASVLERLAKKLQADLYYYRAQQIEDVIQRSMLLLITTEPRELIAGLMRVGDTLTDLEEWLMAALAYERLLDVSPDRVDARDKGALAVSKWRANRRTGARASQEGIAARRGTPALPLPDRLSFVDVHRRLGVDFSYFTGNSGVKYIIESLGGGVAAMDYDGDGWVDLFFPQGCQLPIDSEDRSHLNAVFRNHGGSFENVSVYAGLDQPGYGIGCMSGDSDNDGFPDLVISRYGRNVMYSNNGDGTFGEVTDRAGLGGHHMSTSLAFADLDRDGDLDLYIVNYVNELKVCRGLDDRPVSCRPADIDAEQDQLYENRGDGTFVDVTESSGCMAPNGKGLGVIVADLDDDGWPDVYVANDTTPNFLFQNLKSSRSEIGGSGILLAEQGISSGSAVNLEGKAEGSMGIACADIDNDGRLDLYVTNFQGETNTLYFNQGGLMFRDATKRLPGLSASTIPMVGFGTQAIDVDLDGNVDLFVTNGHVDSNSFLETPEKMRPQLFQNRGALQFQDVSLTSGVFFRNRYLGRGAAELDWDRDGRADLVIVHQNAPAAMLHNETAAVGHAIALRFVGRESNREAVNVRVWVKTKTGKFLHERCGGAGYLSANEPLVLAGLASEKIVQTLDVFWPSGRHDQWPNLAADRCWLLIEGQEPLERELLRGR